MASLSHLSINRPVLAIVMSLIIIIFGIIGFEFLGVREYPSVDPPVISVSTSYPGANADVIESQITEPLEEEVNSVSGIKSITSVSRDGRSTITVEFNLNIDLETAANDVRDKVSQAVRSLPPDAEPPVVSKADADRQPIIGLQLRSQNRSLLQLSDIAENIVKERLQTIDGVSSVDIWGEKKYSMRLWMDPIRLAAYNLTPIDVFNAVNSENIELPSGIVEGNKTELTVRTMGRLTTVEEFNDLIIRENENELIKFKDIGFAELGPENLRTILKRNGEPMVMTVIRAQPGSNNLAIAEEFYNRLGQVINDIPDDVETTIGFDDTEYIRASIDEVEQTIYIAFILVVLIIFSFLRDWRTTFIPVITIPISLIGSFAVLYFAGFSINVLTLLGVVLAIGLVVDDTIVVLENIYAKIERGIKPKEAAMKGATEIFFAVISTTVALVAVFMPVVFLQGLTGRLFREFGVTVAASVIISSFVALTLAPMLSSKMLKHREKHNRIYNITEPFFVWLNNLYARSLKAFLVRRWISFIILLLSGAGIYVLLQFVPSELAPMEDRGTFRILSTAPEGATFEYMDFFTNQVIDMAMDQDHVDNIFSVTSPGFGAASSVNSSFIIVNLVDATERDATQQEVVDEMSSKLSNYTMARSVIVQPASIGNRRGGLDLQYVIQAGDIDKLKEVLEPFMTEARKSDAFSFVDLNLKFNKPQLEISIDREKARQLGVSVSDIARTLQFGISGQRFGYYIMNGKQYQVIGQMQRNDRNEPLDLKTLYVRTADGGLIQMDNLVAMSEESTPPQLFRFNRYASATVSANLNSGYSLSQGIDEMDRIAGLILDESYQTDLDGAAAEFRESSNSLLFALLFAVLLIYLVLSAQFESFRDPLVIMFTVPLAFAGAILSLWLFGETLNIFSQIGIIMLIGLVTKNGILIVEFANQFKARGKDIPTAIFEASKSRFRPILMTALSTILGILPIALALGAGSESRVSMGIAVIGGLIFSTILTLYVIPAMYTYITSKVKREARF